MDRTSPGLGTDTFPTGDLFQRTSGRQKPLKATCEGGLIDIPENPCIMQIWADTKNVAECKDFVIIGRAPIIGIERLPCPVSRASTISFYFYWTFL